MQSSMQRDKKLSAAKSKPFEIKSNNCCRTKVRDLCVNYCLPPSQALCRRAQLVSYLEQRAVETNWDVESLPSRGQDSGWVGGFFPAGIESSNNSWWSRACQMRWCPMRSQPCNRRHPAQCGAHAVGAWLCLLATSICRSPCFEGCQCWCEP